MVPELLANFSRKERVSVPRSTATKKTNTSRPQKKKKYKKEDYPKEKEQFYDRRATMLPNGVKDQALFEEKASSEWMKNKRIPLYYHYNKLEQKFTSGSAYLHACMIPKNNCASFSSLRQM